MNGLTTVSRTLRVPAGASALLMHLVPARGRVVTATARPAHGVGAPFGCVRVDLPDRGVSSVLLRWDCAIPMPADLEITLTFMGEALQVLDGTWYRADEADHVAGAMARGGQAADALSAARAVYDWRNTNTPECTPQRFFFELDRQTIPAFMVFAGIDEAEIAWRTTAFVELEREMSGRLGQRISAARAKDAPPTFQTDTSEDRLERLERLELFSRIFWDIAAPHLYHEDNRSHVDPFTSAVTRFAAGLLRQTRRVCCPRPGPYAGARAERPFGHETIFTEPDSYFIFYFAEFAMLCMEARSDHHEQWEKLLPALVRMQDVFMTRWNIWRALGQLSTTRLRDVQTAIHPPPPLSEELWHVLVARALPCNEDAPAEVGRLLRGGRFGGLPPLDF